jgi:hypothetical protein
VEVIHRKTSRAADAGISSSASRLAPEFWDRFIRDERHYVKAKEYIHDNPVKAGLVGRAEEWEWGSARLTSGKE